MSDESRKRGLNRRRRKLVKKLKDPKFVKKIKDRFEKARKKKDSKKE